MNELLLLLMLCNPTKVGNSRSELNSKPENVFFLLVHYAFQHPPRSLGSFGQRGGPAKKKPAQASAAMKKVKRERAPKAEAAEPTDEDEPACPKLKGAARQKKAPVQQCGIRPFMEAFLEKVGSTINLQSKKFPLAAEDAGLRYFETEAPQEMPLTQRCTDLLRERIRLRKEGGFVYMRDCDKKLFQQYDDAFKRHRMNTCEADGAAPEAPTVRLPPLSHTSCIVPPFFFHFASTAPQKADRTDLFGAPRRGTDS